MMDVILKLPEGCPQRDSISTGTKLSQASSSYDDDKTPPFRFMDLPLEIRYMIYKYLLVVGKCFPTKGSSADPRLRDYKTPCTALLAVSHQIRQEAGPIYFSKNHWALACVHAHEARFSEPTMSRASVHGFSPLARQNIRSLSIAFDFRVLPRNDAFYMRWEAARSTSMHAFEWYEQVDQVERQKHMHDCGWRKVKFVWALISRDILKRFHNLDHLEVNLSYALCHWACCRSADEAARCLAWELGQQEDSYRPRSIQFTNIISEEEEAKMKSAIRQFTTTEGMTFKIRRTRWD